MRFRALVAFFVGTVLFAVVPYFDAEIPGQGERGELVLIAGLGVAVGATVALIAGGWQAWSLSLLAAVAGALAGQAYYEDALEPPPRGGFEAGSVAYGALTAFAVSAPFVVVGALVVAALALPSALRGA